MGGSNFSAGDAICTVFFILAFLFLALSIFLFIKFKIPQLIRNNTGALEQKQIEEIRKNSSAAASNRNKVNVFEELEKKAKVKKSNTHSLNVGPTTGFSANIGNDKGTSVLANNAKSVNPDFVIEKNIMFVSTNEII